MKRKNGCLIVATIYALSTIGKLNCNSEICKSFSRRHGIFQLVAQNTRLGASVIETIVAHTLLMCTLQCISDVLCKSLNYNAKTMRCEKLSGNRWKEGESKLTVANSWEHYELEEAKSACNRTLASYPCGIYQKCEEDAHNAIGYRCVDLQNIALRKQTASQPQADESSPRAVDGNSNVNWIGGSCTITGCCSPLPWWRVDFGGTATVYSIRVTNRGDCCGDRLSNFNVRVGDSNIGRGEYNELCQQNIAVPQGKTSTFICTPLLHGRYLYIQTNLQKELTLCEVEVFGEVCT